MGNVFSSSSTKQVVTQLDLQKYSGFWWEVARYDTLPYEKGCNWASAEYTIVGRTIRLRNTCYMDDKSTRSDDGTIYTTDGSGKLMVSFDRFPGMKAPYWVHCTDYTNFAIVGGPSDKFLWILSRERYIQPDVFKALLRAVSNMGYDTRRLVYDPEIIRDDAFLPVGSSTSCHLVYA